MSGEKIIVKITFHDYASGAFKTVFGEIYEDTMEEWWLTVFNGNLSVYIPRSAIIELATLEESEIIIKNNKNLQNFPKFKEIALI